MIGVREKIEELKQRLEMREDVTLLALKIKERGDELRNAGSLWKLQEAKQWVLLKSLQKEVSHAAMLILVQ